MKRAVKGVWMVDLKVVVVGKTWVLEGAKARHITRVRMKNNKVKFFILNGSGFDWCLIEFL